MKVKAKKLILCQTCCFSTINSIVYAGEYNQEMPQSQMADQQKKRPQTATVTTQSKAFSSLHQEDLKRKLNS